MSALVIAGVKVRQDSEGRFSLNDFHRAAGQENRHRPSIWLDNQQAQDLVAELEAENPATKPTGTLKGRGITGTYVCKELVYAYAMWISPRFHLQVIRTFDAAVNPPANDPAPQRLSVVAEDFDAAKRIACALGLEGNQVLLSAGRMVRETTGVDVLELAGVRRLINEAQEHNHTPTELGVKLGLSAARTNKLLAEHGLQRHVEYAAGKKRWELLPAGQPFAVLTDTAKRHSDGAPVLQILWKESVLAELEHQGARIAASA